MGFLSKVWKKVKKPALALAPVAASFIPGVGPAVSKALSSVTGLMGALGGSSSAGEAARSPPPVVTNPDGSQRVDIVGSKPFPWDAAMGAASTIGSGLLGYYGQRQANAANAAQAERQMEFQREMSSTSYQRGTEDMKAAGLNPMLGYSQGGASTPGGASATMGNEQAASLQAALNVAQSMSALKMQGAQTHQIESQTANTDADTLNKIASEALIRAQTGTQTSTAKQLEASVHEILSRTTGQDLSNQYHQETMDDRVREAISRARLTAGQAKATEYGLSEARETSRFYDRTGTTNQVLKTLSVILNGAKSAASLGRP